MNLRPYQNEAVSAIEEEWQEGRKKTLLVLPTGCGKTIVFCKIAENRVKMGDRVLILAHRDELLSQAADKLQKSTGLMTAKEKAEETCLGSWFRVVVGSVQSMMRENRLSRFPEDYFSTIIIDEAHHCLTNSYQRVLEHFDGARVLGVTATPDRSDMRNLGQYFDSLAYEYTLPRAIKEGYLCRIQAMTVPLNIDLTGVRTQSGDYALADVGTALDPYLSQIADEMKKHCASRKTVVFLPLIKTSQKFCHLLQSRGFRAAEVNGESEDRAEILEAFDRGEYDVLCNSMLLTEGWDCPSVNCIVVLRPTKVRSLYCLDTQTEVLTPGGWKTSIRPGEEVLAFDSESGRTKFVPAQAVVRRPLDPDEYFCSIQSQSVDIRVTNHHRMLYDNKRRTGWKIKEAEQIADMRDGVYIPVAGREEFPGVPLTDDELRFIGWVMTDGCINKANNAIMITQSEHQAQYCEEIESAIRGCGFKFTRGRRKREPDEIHWNAKGDMIYWTISKGLPRGRDKDKTGWGRLEKWLSKDLSPALYDMTAAQFEIMLEAINHGDGHKTSYPSMHIGKGNRIFIERLQAMAVRRGYRTSVSVEPCNKVRKCDLWTLHIKRQDYIKIGAMQDRHSHWKKEPHIDEECWCVQNELGTLVTRRNGKVAIVGNCQMVGRGTRLSPGKENLLLLDFLWHTSRHELCRPAHLICETPEVADKMTENLNDAPGCPMDLEAAEKQASQDVLIQREEALAKTLQEMRRRKRVLVDPLQFEMSIAAEDLSGYVPAFGWQMAPPSDKQKALLEKRGIFPDEIDNAGKAQLLIDRLYKRQSEGLTTPKQIRFLEGRGFQHVGTWTFDSAKHLINRIAVNGWRVPRDITPSSYQPEVYQTADGGLDVGEGWW